MEDQLALRSVIQCKECGFNLMKKDFSGKSQIEQVYETDMKIRSRVLRIYNKQREDFDTEDEYNRYLEEIEDIIEGIDTKETERRIEEYKRANKRNIAINSTRREEERRRLREHVKAKDCELREDNRKYYEQDEINEEPMEVDNLFSDNRFAQMAEQIGNAAKQQVFNSVLLQHKLSNLTIPKPKSSTVTPGEKTREEKEILAKRASGYSSKWIFDRCLHEIRTCIGVGQSK